MPDLAQALWAAEAKPWGQQPKQFLRFDADDASTETIVIDEDTPQPTGLDSLTPRQRGLLLCNSTIAISRPCGHQQQVPCMEALKRLTTGQCEHLVSVACEDCGTESLEPCHRAIAIELGTVQHICQQLITKVCMTCFINEQSVSCSVRHTSCAREVTAQLGCGHSISWRCGEDADPRIDNSQACSECTLSRWMLEDKSPHLTVSLDQLRGFAMSALHPHPTVEHKPLEPSFKPLLNWHEGMRRAQRKIVSTYVDLIRASIENGEMWDSDRAEPPDLSDLKSYQPVFCRLRADRKDDEQILCFFQQQDTRYGTGVQILPLTTDNMKAYTAEEDLSLRICVGVAFGFSPLVGTAPFKQALAPGSKSKVKKGAANDNLVKANRHAFNAQQRGYDYVIPSSGDQKMDSSRIYWLPGSVIPLSIVTIRIHRSCASCKKSNFISTDGAPGIDTDEMLCDFLCHSCRRDCFVCVRSFAAAAGLECRDKHFVCRACLQRHCAQLCSQPDHFAAHAGITCPFTTCGESFAESVLAKCVAQATMDEVLKAKQAGLERQFEAVTKAQEELYRDQLHQAERQKAEAERAGAKATKERDELRIARAMPDYWEKRIATSSLDGLAAIALDRTGRDRSTWAALERLLQTDPVKLKQSGADRRAPVTHDRLELACAWRLENPSLWEKYMSGVQGVMNDMKRIRQGRVASAGGAPPLTCRVADALPGDLRVDVNEAFLMHGTNAGVLINILSTGMNERFAGTAAGAAYGEGSYLAEDAGKNDQYTKVDPQYDGSSELHKRLYAHGARHHPGKVFYILVCRVALGHQVRTQEHGPLATSSDTGRRVFPISFRELDTVAGVSPPVHHHSLLADVIGIGRRYREYIVFHSEYIYPEYLLAYQRY